jgi:general secretion pathway protein F
VPSYHYRGVGEDGRAASGTLEADSPRSARARLRERGIFANELTETAAGAGGRSEAAVRSPLRRVRPRQISRMARSLATLLHAGVPLADAVRSLARQQTNRMLGGALESIHTRLVEGMSLARAIGEHPDVFPGLYIGMIEAGEASGALESVLRRIADHAEGQARLASRVRTALMYPAVMTLVGGGIVLFLLSYVVPQVTRVFDEARQGLPLPTRILMGMSAFVADYGLVAAVVLVGVAVAARMALARPAGRRVLERLLGRVPFFGRIVRNVAAARFSQTLATMVAGGMPLIGALRIARASAGSLLLADEVERAEASVAEGGSLAQHLSTSELFDPMIVDMIAVGESSGDLEGMLGRAAEAVDEEVAVSVDTMAGLLEPAMIVVMAGIVLFIVLAIMLPVFEMNQLVR